MGAELPITRRPGAGLSARTRPTGMRAAALGLFLTMTGVAAQEDLTRPPRISDDEPPTPATRSDQAQERVAEAALEEIVVVSDQNPWRLPDLGSGWRENQEAAADTGRISADLLPLWDPEESELPTRDPFAVGDSFRRTGFIEVFRVRFGRR